MLQRTDKQFMIYCKERI